MAADRTRTHSVCRSLVPSILVVVARCRRAPGGARPGSRSHDGVALGAALWPLLEQRMRRHLKPTNKSWRVDETHLKVKGRWCYLYRAIDSAGATIDFLSTAFRDADAA